MDTHEPKDGDFIAYIDQLQKESAARLLGPQHAVNQLDKTPAKGAAQADSHFFAGRKPADMRSAAVVLQQSFASTVPHASIGKLLGSVVLIAIGIVFAFYWLIANASIAVLILGVALIAWGVRRIKAALRLLSPQQSKQLQAQVSKVFSAPTKAK